MESSHKGDLFQISAVFFNPGQLNGETDSYAGSWHLV